MQERLSRRAVCCRVAHRLVVTLTQEGLHSAQKRKFLSKIPQTFAGQSPVSAAGKLFDVTRASRRAVLAESLCIGRGICVKRCPFSAITIINLPEGLSSAR